MSRPNFEDENNQPKVNGPVQEDLGLLPLSIQDLPEEVFEIIVSFLKRRDIENCLKVCNHWKHVLDSNKYMRKCCIYHERYYKLLVKQNSEKATSVNVCQWKKNYLAQQGMWENWRRGKFVSEMTVILVRRLTCLVDSVDQNGNHWLFDFGEQGIMIWNITSTPVLHSVHSDNDFFGLLPLQDKVIASRSNYVKIFQFRHPKYKLKIDYRFKFDDNDVLPENHVVPDDEYVSGVRYILVDNQFFIGYHQNITDIQRVFIHIWDLNLGRKIATHRVFQESFVTLVQLGSRSDAIDNDFKGGLILFAGDNGRFLVNLIDDRNRICHISLFSLAEMKITKIIAKLESRTAWCFMKGGIIVIFHIIQESSSQISVFNIHGALIGKLDFQSSYNPAFTDEFRFDSNKVILKFGKIINVLTINDDMTVARNNFEVEEDLFILRYFDPKFLLLFDRRWNLEFTVTVWDIDSGVKLWELGTLSKIYIYRQMFNNLEYPGRLLVCFKGNDEISLLKFEEEMLNKVEN